jgi:hypothetical protein
MVANGPGITTAGLDVKIEAVTASLKARANPQSRETPPVKPRPTSKAPCPVLAIFSCREGGKPQRPILGPGSLPLLLLATILVPLMVVTMNRLVWRRLYRLAETRYKLEG